MMTWLATLLFAALAVCLVAFGWQPCCCANVCCATATAPVSVTLTVIKSGSRACDVCYGGISQTVLVSTSANPWGSSTFQVAFFVPIADPSNPCSSNRTFTWGCSASATNPSKMAIAGPAPGQTAFGFEDDKCVLSGTPNMTLVGSESCYPLSQTWTGTLIHDPLDFFGSCACAGDTITAIITGNY